MANLQSLQKFISFDLTILFSVYWILFQECRADASWTSFALCPTCTNTRLVVLGNLFEPRLIGKGTSLIWARIDCSRSCANQDSCHAFNFYENENFYVCELLSDNLRRNKTVLQMLAQPGCSVWEKLSTDPNSFPTEVSAEPTLQASTAKAESSTDTSTNPSTVPTSTASTVMTESSTVTSITTSTELTTKASTAMTHSSTVTSPKITTSSTTLTTGMALPATTTIPQMCAVVRPGCLGTYPNCYSCIKTCKESTSRSDFRGADVVLWPDGDGPDSVPIPATCAYDSILLIHRSINLTHRYQSENKVMSFYDMNRLIKLNVHSRLNIMFSTVNTAASMSGIQRDRSDYTNVFISPNGTLSNLIYDTSLLATVDIFNLQGQPMKPTPFVNVTDDRYSCGSFWLLDTSNATYCPGGTTSMFGALKTNAYQVVNTGIRIPTKPNSFTFLVKVLLVP